VPATKKTPATKTAPAKHTILVGPVYKDPKISALVKRSDKALKAMTAEAATTLKDFHANKLEVVTNGSFSLNSLEVLHSFYPLLRLSRFADSHWELIKALAEHHVSPTKRKENRIIALREKLLDLLDDWDIAPLYEAWREREARGAGGKEYKAYVTAKREQRRARLGLTPAQFEKLLKDEKAAQEADMAAAEARFKDLEKQRKAQEKAKRAGKALA
jgi:hypothetical protein